MRVLAAAFAILVTGAVVGFGKQAPRSEAADGVILQNTGIAELLIGLRPSSDDMQVYSDAKIASLHSGLGLDEVQEKNWPAFERAVHYLAKLRIDGHSTDPEHSITADPVRLLFRQAHFLDSRSSGLKQLADTLEPLYRSLDDGQKHRFAVLASFVSRRPLHLGKETIEKSDGFTSVND